MNDLNGMRRNFDQMLRPVIWIHVSGVCLAAWACGNDWVWLGLVAAAVAAVASIGVMRAAGEKSTRLTNAVAMIAMVSLVLAGCRGSVWQSNVHMYYFAMLAVLTAYCDRDVILAGATATATHHLALNFLMPALVFPGGADLARVVLHATILIAETGALVWIATRIESLFVVAAGHVVTANAALTDATKAQAAGEILQRKMDDSRKSTLSDVARQLEQDLQGAVEALSAATQNLEGRSSSLSDNAASTGNESQKASEQGAATLVEMQAVAVAVEELTRSIHEIDRQIGAAAETGRRTNVQVCATRDAITTLSGEAAGIGDVVKLINDIAAQTNLLALNATIEAARAGDAGKGFAVVAGEVKDLAAQTARATGQIQSQIAALQSGTANAVDAIALIASMIGDINDVTNAVVAVVSEQQAATMGMSRSAQSAAIGVNTMAQRMASAAIVAKETSELAAAVSNDVILVDRTTTTLAEGVVAVISQLRTA